MSSTAQERPASETIELRTPAGLEASTTASLAGGGAESSPATIADPVVGRFLKTLATIVARQASGRARTGALPEREPTPPHDFQCRLLELLADGDD
jgi:hypothetical protein